MSKNTKRQIIGKKNGFTLIEIMTVVTIFTVISIITITTFPNFSSKIEFDNQILDIAIDVREAQVHGMGVREAGIGTGVFDKAYGIHFNTLNFNSYILFIDKNDDGMYTSVLNEQIGSNIPLKTGFEIDTPNGLCVVNGGVETCSSDLNITFKRPNPDAKITPTGTSAIVKIKDSSGNIRKMITTNTGQIYTE